MGDEWCTIESDPGVFTDLCESIGVQGVEFQEVYALDAADLKAMAPHALIFLFKWTGTPHGEPKAFGNDESLFFAKQVTQNACATQAILNALMNADGVEIGSTLSELKSFTAAFDSQMKGLSISSSDIIRTAHNKFHRHSSFDFDQEKREKEDAFHFVSYLWHGGKVYELDGLQEGPMVVAECDKSAWLDHTVTELQQRIESYQKSGSELRFNLMGVVQAKLPKLSHDLLCLKFARQRATVKLLSLGEDVELEDDLDDDEAPATVPAMEDLPEELEELKAFVVMQNTQIVDLEAAVKTEEDKKLTWKKENKLRMTDLTPVALCLLKHLAKKRALTPLFNTAVESAKASRANQQTQAA